MENGSNFFGGPTHPPTSDFFYPHTFRIWCYFLRDHPRPPYVARHHKPIMDWFCKYRFLIHYFLGGGKKLSEFCYRIFFSIEFFFSVEFIFIFFRSKKHLKKKMLNQNCDFVFRPNCFHFFDRNFRFFSELKKNGAQLRCRILCSFDL